MKKIPRVYAAWVSYVVWMSFLIWVCFSASSNLKGVLHESIFKAAWHVLVMIACGFFLMRDVGKGPWKREHMLQYFELFKQNFIPIAMIFTIWNIGDKILVSVFNNVSGTAFLLLFVATITMLLAILLIGEKYFVRWTGKIFEEDEDTVPKAT